MVYKKLVKPETQSLIQEIALAMFRVASVAKHEGVKSSLENLAVKISAEESPEYIRRAESLIILGRETGDIKEINAIVLLRELANLKDQLKVVEEEEGVDISSMFNPSASISSVIPAKEGIQSASSPISPISSRNLAVAKARIQSASPVSLDNISKAASTGVKKHGSINPDKILDYIKEHKVARLKELESAFKEVSGRTVRRITDTLIKDGRIERVGNPGPTSFYRPKTSVPHVSAFPIPSTYPNFGREPVTPSYVSPSEVNSSLIAS